MLISHHDILKRIANSEMSHEKLSRQLTVRFTQSEYDAIISYSHFRRTPAAVIMRSLLCETIKSDLGGECDE